MGMICLALFTLNRGIHQGKYRGYLLRQVVFRLGIDVSLLKSQAGMRILLKSAVFADFAIMRFRASIK